MAQNIFKTATGSTGPNGTPIFDVFEGNRKLELPEFQQRGLNIDQIQIGQAPTGFQSQFSAMTPESLANTNPLNLTYPGTNTPYPVAGLTTPDLTLTPEEKNVQDEQNKQRDLNNQMLGKSAFQTEQETKFGVDTAQANINDLSAQLTRIKNEAAAIPLSFQQNAAGQTTTILNNQTNAALRSNAIAALGVSTLLAASQGQLANAQAMADRAVAERYEPVLEAIEANKANLQLLLDSPGLTLSEKNRANVQKEIQDRKAEEIAEKKDLASQIQKLAIAAIENGASASVATQIMNLAQSDDPDFNKALGLYAPYASKGTDSDINLSTANKTKLIGAGFSSGEITQIENDINQYGIDSVLEGMSDSQKKIVQEIYGVKETLTRDKIAGTVTQKIAQDKLKEEYTTDELAKFADEAGFSSIWSKQDTEIKNWLNSENARLKYVELLFEKYKDAGLAS